MLATDGRAVLMDFGTGWEIERAHRPRPARSPARPCISHRSCFAAAMPRFRAISTALACCSIAWSPAPTRCTLAGSRSASCPRASRARRRCHSRSDVSAASAGRHHRSCDRSPMPSAATKAPTRSPPLSARSHRARAVIPLKYAIAIAAALSSRRFAAGGRNLCAATRAAIQSATVAQHPLLPSRSDGPAIAVLPLKNLSAEPGSEEFVDGFTEEIINSLAANDASAGPLAHVEFCVQEQSTRFARRGHAAQCRASCSTGSIRRSGNHFHIDARLLQASTGVTLWNESFDRDVGDVFAIRDRITREVVEQLGVTAGVSRRAYDLNPEAYGRYLDGTSTRESPWVPACRKPLNTSSKSSRWLRSSRRRTQESPTLTLTCLFLRIRGCRSTRPRGSCGLQR